MAEHAESTGHGAASDPDEWVDRHGDGLYRYALLRLRDPDRAAEAVQETFLEALRGRERFAGRSAERTWLIGILRHKIIDHHRRARREINAGDGRPDGESDHAPAFFDDRGHWRYTPRSWPDDPGAALERREFWDVMGGCLDRLPPRLAEAFILREVEGLPADEICATLDITPANFWARCSRARLLLRGCLESRWFGGPARPAAPRTAPEPKTTRADR